MNILIVGCGKVGNQLAKILSDKNHDVSIIAKNEVELDNLDDSFEGLRFIGVPIDQDVLKKAGIESCDVVCAVTNDDNTNIMVSQLAREIYKVEQVITRILDPERGDIFSKFGLHTICPTNLTVDAVCSAIEHYCDEQFLKFGPHIVKFTTMDMPKEFVGRKVSEIEYEENEILYGIIEPDGVLKMHDSSNPVLAEGEKLVFSKIIN